MSFFGKPLAVAVSAVALSGASLAPLGFALAAGAAPAHAAPGPVQVASAPTPLPLPSVSRPSEALVVEQPATPEEADAQDVDEPSAPQVAESELNCLAKVIVHEAGNQPREGQMAVAQVVMNRVNDSRHRFGRTICGVVMQRGQFFNVHAYNPPRNSRWFRAMDIAREAASGNAEPVMEGALFFHAAYAGNVFHGRTRLGRIGGHVFYR
jgi:spore germination cell wall hydrolase CwlJ-like protein